MVGVIPLPQAVYCSNPDAVQSCWKLCPAADTVSIGVRLGCYLQAIAFFVLCLVAPDEGGAESLWLGLSVSFCFVASNYIMLWLHMITMHHTIIVILLSHLPYIATLSGLNSLTSYEVLGPAGVRFLQSGLILKALSTAILWALCIWGYAAGRLPDWLHFQFRQVNCLEQTKIVLWFVPVSKLDGGMSRTDIFLMSSYSLFWFIVLVCGSYWSAIAPIVLVKRGGHLRDPKKKKIRGFPHIKKKLEEDRKKRRHMKDDPADYTPASDDGDALLQMVMRSVPKGRSTQQPQPESQAQASSIPLPLSPTNDSSVSLPSYHTTSASLPAPTTERLPSASQGATFLSTWSKGVRGSPQGAYARWTRRQLESRHHFIIWPICALLLTFAIVTIELQIAMNDVFPGELALDFPGVLTFFLALPTVWAVGKALRRIQEGRRPTPMEREDKTFLELAAADAQHRQRSRRRGKLSRSGARTFSMGHETPRRRGKRREMFEEEEGSEGSEGSESGMEGYEPRANESTKKRDGRRYGRV
ncbi:uncharacterized protein JCM6883_004152 [Sporobolomyces salmoneus]|uniref:uncharacterized protein n=1 Tax=Sporobolomyces salmoneus TaxID=183962 RepID=UPI0031727FB3